MSVLERFGIRRGLPANANFRLTQEGRDKLQDFRGDARSRILVALETQGTSSASEIASSSGLSKGKVEMILPSMIRGGFIQLVSGNTIEEG